MCGILNHSFKILRTNWGCMFGNGVYTTTVSSKADLFAENQDIHSRLHAVFICRIVSNRPQYLRRPDNFRTRPDRGYDSVEAVLTHNGGTVRYPETIVYREDAVIPVGVILYTWREWLP
ncbi:PARP catalytic domain-containing protein [Fusarium keratoplasticum]|uniref:PARP catalytic domain-containing protein n=1 Tax=Fusarium keratoplasticum TaxID=1328300 RepID=A0ACC0QYM9_9HYPO|nr:PARP catalytic domain-containing protein [Fusarium keratoplasticum]KAI8669625.1 PARP catalytic domain-containing protein [Fusarium keratoplasticum]KAI8674219.1 PARP catalytic domain-containing protein [Fusarium keratoplasticum]